MENGSKKNPLNIDVKLRSGSRNFNLWERLAEVCTLPSDILVQNKTKSFCIFMSQTVTEELETHG